MTEHDQTAPALLAHLDRLRPGIALDLASGSGRNALALARRGLRVECWDRDAAALAELRRRAALEQVEQRVTTREIDLETASFAPPASGFDAVIVFRYLWRPLAPVIASLLAPGGTLIYETYVVDPANQGGPRRADFLLKPNELYRLFPSLDVHHYHERLVGDTRMALLVAARPHG